MSSLPDRPITVLIAALGGEGGSVLADWLVDAAHAEGYPVQATSIPGVSQRTGATTYYVEIYPVRAEELNGREPVLALVPSPGNVDVMVASELIEAGRAMQNGFVSPGRTTLIASTHRVYATSEKLPLGDGRYAGDAVIEAATHLAQRTVLFDMSRLAQATGSIINTVLFGAMAGTGALPLSRQACESAIRRAGKGVDASLRGFEAGFAAAGKQPATTEEAARSARAAADLAPALRQRIAAEFPADMRNVLELAAARLIDYQDEAYAALYLDRLSAVLAAEQGSAQPGSRVTGEVARHLAVWMSYEDVIRVAQLKTRRARFERIRREVGATSGEPVTIVDYFKPGSAELADVLTPRWADRLRERQHAKGEQRSVKGGWQLKSSNVFGFMLLRTAVGLRRWRRRTARFSQEQALVERWLAAVLRTIQSDSELALEVAHCARLIKGYSDTHARGRANFERIFSILVESGQPLTDLARRVRQAREAALADADGKALSGALNQTGAGRSAPSRAQTVVFMPRPRRSASDDVGAAPGS